MTNNEPPFASIHRGWVIAIGLVVFSLGLALFTAGAHHRLVFMEKLGEVILVVMSLHFLYEQFVRRVDRYAAHEQMSALLQPQQEVLERLDQRVGDLGGKIADLESRFSTSFNVIPYTDGNYFEKHWEIIVDKFDQLALIGDCPHEIWFRTIDKVHRSSGGKKHLTIYTSVNYSNKSVLQEIVKNHLRQRGRVQIRHVERTDLSFIALGWNGKESSAQVLLNHASAYQGSDHDSEGNPWGGHHLFGAPALEVYKSKVLQFADHPANESLHDAARSALLRICDAEVLDLVAAKHAAHQNDLKSLAQGVPIRGCDEICDRMIQAIRETDKTAVITHIVTTQKQIDILFRRSFSRWIQANVEAVQRGVHVTRVFLITRELMHDARIVAIANEMRRANIDVRFAVWEELDGGSRYDFSVYDDKRHIRILTQAGGGWGKDGTTDEEAVTTTDPLAINKFSQLFREISRGSRPFPVNPPVDEDPIEGQVQIVGGVAT